MWVTLLIGLICIILAWAEMLSSTRIGKQFGRDANDFWHLMRGDYDSGRDCNKDDNDCQNGR